MIGEENPPIHISKAAQISAPSDPQIIELVAQMAWRVSRRRRFLGQTVTRQIFINCIFTGLASAGPETWDYLFDEGADILGPAIMAGEPGVAPTAGRPLRKRFKWFSEPAPIPSGFAPMAEEDEEEGEEETKPANKPLPSVKMEVKKDAGGRRKGKG